MAAEGTSKVGLFRSNSEGNYDSVVSDLTLDIPWASGIATQQAKCDCCGLLEECTVVYVQRVKDLHCGHFICGLCAEAVKEELLQNKTEQIKTMKDALESHMSICIQFNSPERADPITQRKAALAAMRKILLRRMMGTPDAQKHRGLAKGSRTSSCIPVIGHNSSLSSASRIN